MKNNYKDYAWNEFEKSSYLNGEIKIPSKYKIKINDDLEKRIELELILEKLPQYYLSYWAITNAKRYIDDININNENLKNSIIEETLKALENRIEGKINAYNLRKAGFLANTLSKKSVSEVSKYAARVFAQAIATGHMRGHAIVSSDYAIKVINLKYTNNYNIVINERNIQIELAKSFLLKAEDYIDI
ncbi:hypothetical protein HMPREF0491_00401 [Lachnospiraceae oral taxon 107 str. F0167]|nr:hypothetical protein HMPREF0491_00401 [Lachnospiraceae oral taxon 107 str. F0167]